MWTIAQTYEKLQHEVNELKQRISKVYDTGIQIEINTTSHDQYADRWDALVVVQNHVFKLSEPLQAMERTIERLQELDNSMSVVDLKDKVTDFRANRDIIFGLATLLISSLADLHTNYEWFEKAIWLLNWAMQRLEQCVINNADDFALNIS